MTLINPTRRNFLMGSAALAGSGWLFNSTALAAVDPNSFSGRIFSASHYGPFEAVGAMAGSSASAR
jgi:trimethylamine-N-oxide reductase (cytochrome c)